MKPIKVLELTEVDRLKLEKGYYNGPTHKYRIRCKSILLKSEGKSASQIAEQLEVTVPTVYSWIKRYEENGIKGKRSCKNLKHLIPKAKSYCIMPMKVMYARMAMCHTAGNSKMRMFISHRKELHDLTSLA